MKKKLVYISGKISGERLDEVEAKFYQAAEMIKEHGYEPVNPMNNGLDRNALWEQHILRDIELLFNSDMVLMLPDWTQSSGARIEHFIAHEKRLPVYYNEMPPTQNNDA